MREKNNVRFIRRNGKVIPIRVSGYGESKRYGEKNRLPKVSQTSKGVSAIVGLANAGILRAIGFGGTASTLLGVATYASLRSTKHTTRAKGESDFQLGRRVAMGNRAYQMQLRKNRS